MTIPVFLKNFSMGPTVRQKQAMDSFVKKGLPTRKIENWHYTDLRKILHGDCYENCSPVEQGIPDTTINIENTIKVFVVNGRYSPGAGGNGTSVAGMEGVTITTPTAIDGDKCPVGQLAQVSDHAMVALNSALYTNSICIDIAKDLKKPLHICFVTHKDNVALFPRVFIRVKKNVKATIVETHESSCHGPKFVSSVCEIVAEEGAHLTHYKVQNDQADMKHISYTHVEALERATYRRFSVFLEGMVSRDEVYIDLRGMGSVAVVKGIFLAEKSQILDNTVHIAHNTPNCTSEQLFKGLLQHKAKASFQGKIFVDKVAQKTDGYQMHRAIMLSRDSEVYVKPELEIYADDVKCSHGTTAGELDKQQLFYLMSRGIEESDAKHLLLEAFLLEVVEDSKEIHIKDFLMTLVSAKTQNVLE